VPLIPLNVPINTSKPTNTDTVSSDINSIVSHITAHILSDCPSIVADTANSLLKPEVLETAIIKDIDRHKYQIGLSRDELIKMVFDYIFGFGPFQKYIEDEDISDIDGSGYKDFTIKKNGKRQRIDVNFGNNDIFKTFLRAIAVRYNGILNENDSQCRVVDINHRLRITLSLPPRNVLVPSICIRKHRKVSYTLSDLVRLGLINTAIAQFLKQLATQNASILFCGKGAAGKTTLLRAFINSLPELESVLIAESDPEIYPDNPLVKWQRVKYPNEGGRPITLSDIVRDALKMSIDTIVIGESVGNEMWDLIDAGFTGHRVLSSIHSESAEDSLPRAYSLAKRAIADEQGKNIKDYIAKSFDYVVYLQDFKVVDILKVKGYDSVTDKFLYNQIFKE
jgi:pilus assembly protein CpaF